MRLVSYVAADEDALICDFAEYYKVLNWRELPLRLAATLASGLPDNSRSVRGITGNKVSIEVTLLATIADRLGLLLWAKTKDGQKNRNRPPQLLTHILGEDKKEIVSLSSKEDLDRAYREILGG